MSTVVNAGGAQAHGRGLSMMFTSIAATSLYSGHHTRLYARVSSEGSRVVQETTELWEWSRVERYVDQSHRYGTKIVNIFEVKPFIHRF